MENRKIYFENLDAIRFIAATMVFIQHSIRKQTGFDFIENSFIKQVVCVMSNGDTGVSIFFVLSGFLITYLLISEYELKSEIQIFNFYTRRLLRIWPLYFAVITVAFVVFPILQRSFDKESVYNIRYHLVFLSNFDLLRVVKCCIESVTGTKSITWSVSVEEQFYLVWPLIFTFLSKEKWVYMISFFVIGSFAFRVYNHNDEFVLEFHTFSVLIDLGIGGLFAYMVKNSRKFLGFFEGIDTKGHLTLFLLSFILLFIDPYLKNIGYFHAVDRLFISTSFALIICAQSLTKNQSVLNLKRLTFFNAWGKYTYGIYLIHPFILVITDALAAKVHFPKDHVVDILILTIFSFCLTLVVSKLSYTYYESRFLRLKDKFAIIKSYT